MKKLLLATAATLIAGSAYAADLPSYQDTQQPYQAPSNLTWTGFYAGANLGGSFAGNFDARLSGTRLNSASGIEGGIQAGYNFQYDPIVVGIEGAINYGDITDSFNGARGHLGLNGSITPRLGYAMGNFMPYVKLGLALGNVEIKDYGAQDSQTLGGWTAGFGAEYKLTNEISLRAEYNYTGLSRASYQLGSIPTKASYGGSNINLGVNYHF